MVYSLNIKLLNTENMSYRTVIESCRVCGGSGKVQDQNHRSAWMTKNVYIAKIRGDRPEWESKYKPKYITCHYCKGSKKNKVSYRESGLTGNEVEISREPISGGCFISTAVMSHLRRTDDCIELTQLRKFRDTYVKRENEFLIDLYYEIAPYIVQKINDSNNPEQEYQDLWENYIKICYNLILLEKQEEALITYEVMLQELCDKYIVIN